MRNQHVITILGLLALAGCSGGSDLSSAEDKTLRGKIESGLSPEEVEKHFGKEAADKMRNGGGAAAPPPVKSGS